jgi:adenosylcobinamide amidohydrolase
LWAYAVAVAMARVKEIEKRLELAVMITSGVQPPTTTQEPEKRNRTKIRVGSYD